MRAIEIDNLTKRFGKYKALNGLTMSVEPGEVFGFIGPNGAGKTTTIRIVLGLLTHDGGEVKLLGGDPWKDSVALHRRLAYVPGDVSLWPNLSGGEVIDLLGRLRGHLDPKRRAELIERFNLDPTKLCRTYSKGNRQKVALVSAFSSNAELFMLDEPTSGLDPLMEAVFRECVLEAKRAGKTVLLSSHILAEVEQLCEKICIIKDGKSVEAGTLTELRHLTRMSLSVETERPVDGLAALPGVRDLEVEGPRARFTVDSASLDAVLRHLVGFGVRALSSTPPTLEELFMRHYKSTPAEKSGSSESGGRS